MLELPRLFCGDSVVRALYHVYRLGWIWMVVLMVTIENTSGGIVQAQPVSTVYDPQAISGTSWAHPGAQFHTDINTECSVGFPAEDNQGNHYFLTAMHCFVDQGKLTGSVVYDYDSHTQKWNTVVGYLFKYALPYRNEIIDAALVKMKPTAVLTGGFVDVPRDIASHPYAGETICTAGFRDFQKHCGHIDRPLVFRYDSMLRARSEAFTANICILSGDSGGPVWSEGAHGGAIGLIQASNGTTDSCAIFPRSWHTPLWSALKMMRTAIPSLHLV